MLNVERQILQEMSEINELKAKWDAKKNRSINKEK